MLVSGIINMYNAEFEKLKAYVRSKNINISDKAIDKMIKFKQDGKA